MPGAVAYRAINTLDSMVGYRGPFEALGKASARLDDVVNWVPARLTAALLLVAGWVTGLDVAGGWRIFRRDKAKTPSPNGGRPMAMAAGLLGVRLEKPGAYVLGDQAGSLTAATVTRAWRLVVVASWLMVGLCALGLVGVHWLRWNDRAPFSRDAKRSATPALRFASRLNAIPPRAAYVDLVIDNPKYFCRLRLC